MLYMMSQELSELRLVFVHQEGGLGNCRSCGDMADTLGLSTGKAALDHSVGGIRALHLGAGIDLHDSSTRLLAAEPDHEAGLGQKALDEQRNPAAKTQVNVIPEKGRITPQILGYVWRLQRMAMAFDYVEVEGHGHFEQRSGELAQAAAERRYNAAFSHLASSDKATRMPRRADLPPQTEDRARGQDPAMDPPARHAEILYLSQD
jgi:hypothetical protein